MHPVGPACHPLNPHFFFHLQSLSSLPRKQSTTPHMATVDARAPRPPFPPSYLTLAAIPRVPSLLLFPSSAPPLQGGSPSRLLAPASSSTRMPWLARQGARCRPAASLRPPRRPREPQRAAGSVLLQGEPKTASTTSSSSPSSSSSRIRAFAKVPRSFAKFLFIPDVLCIAAGRQGRDACILSFLCFVFFRDRAPSPRSASSPSSSSSTAGAHRRRSSPSSIYSTNQPYVSTITSHAWSSSRLCPISVMSSRTRGTSAMAWSPSKFR